MGFFCLFFYLIFIRLLDVKAYAIREEYKMTKGKFHASKVSDIFLPDVSAERISMDHNTSFFIL